MYRLSSRIYHALPLGPDSKKRLKDWVYSNFGFFFRGSVNYGHWRRDARFDRESAAVREYERKWGIDVAELGSRVDRLLAGENMGAASVPSSELFMPPGLLTLNSRLAEEVATRWVPLSQRPRDSRSGLGHRVTIYVSSLGNLFFREIAEILTEGFRATGAEVRLLDENDISGEKLEGPKDHSIIVAPHEFFLLGDGSRHMSSVFLSRSLLWVAEQPGTKHFLHVLSLASQARGVLDANPLIALVWRELNVNARALPVGWLEGMTVSDSGLEVEAPHMRAALRPEARPPVNSSVPWSERPVEILFNGVLTPRREAFFSAHAEFFGSRECMLLMPDSTVPVAEGLASSVSSHDGMALSQRAKIQLNIHRNEFSYFEWHRIVVRGICQGALVVTEPCHYMPGLKPGIHYIECSLVEMPERIERLLDTAEGREEAEKIIDSAKMALRQAYPFSAMAADFLLEDERAGE